MWKWFYGLMEAVLGTPKRAAVSTGSAVLVAAAVFVGPWEGLRQNAYLDRIAATPVWTVCYGETKGVKAGDSYSAAECQTMLQSSLRGYYDALAKCIPSLPKQPEGVQVALTSWTYNVGAGAACKSTLAKRANVGQWQAACTELLKWDKAGGKVIRGLTNRRQAEYRLCTSSL